MTDTTSTSRTTRAQRMAMPLARQVVEGLAVEHGACIRPIQLRRTSLDTGEQDTVLVPCGNTLASVCPSCAERAKTLRATQCREGWHLEDEPDLTPDPATEDQKWWIEKRAETQQLRDQAASAGQDTTDLDELVRELDEEITNAGMRGKVAPAKPTRRHRSTRRRQDAPDLPRRKISPRTVGKTYTTLDGKTFRPSLFHAARLAEALRYQPCSPTCANWLRYGVQPKNPRPGLVPGRCRGKAHDADHLGYAGRRVLASRKWSGKTLANHRADRQEWLLSTLGVSATDPALYAWEVVVPGDPDHMDHARRLLHAVADRARWQAALNEARRRVAMPSDGDLSAAGKAA